MHPILIDTSWFFLPTWHFFYLLAAFAAFFTIKLNAPYLLKDDSKELTHLKSLFILAYISGYLGSRVFSIFWEETDPASFLELLKAILSLGPMTLYGGVLLAFINCYLFCLWYSINFTKILELISPSALLAIGIGRLGCFFNGDDYGITTESLGFLSPPFWSVRFKNHLAPLERVPVQLIESFFCIFFAYFFMKRLKNSNRTKKYQGLTILAFYAFMRFFIEFLRDDERGVLFLNSLSTSQSISLMILFLIGIIKAKKRILNQI